RRGPVHGALDRAVEDRGAATPDDAHVDDVAAGDQVHAHGAPDASGPVRRLVPVALDPLADDLDIALDLGLFTARALGSGLLIATLLFLGEPRGLRLAALFLGAAGLFLPFLLLGAALLFRLARLLLPLC